MNNVLEKSHLMQSKEPDWTSFDDLIMEKIFEQLSIRDRFSASLVAKRWSHCFELPNIWRNVDITEQWITTNVWVDGESSKVFNYNRVANCLQHVGHHIRNIYIQCSQDFACLYQFFVLFTWFIDKQVTSLALMRILLFFGEHAYTFKWFFFEHLFFNDQ